MYYSLNKYAAVYENDRELFLHFNNRSYALTKEEYEFLSSNREERELVLKIGEKKIREFISIGVLKNAEENKEENRLSRTEQFNKETNFIDKKNIDKKILILGAGGTGSNLCYLLFNSGFTNITILDYDRVEISNLNRQVVYNINNIGIKKTDLLNEEFEGKVKTIDKKIKKQSDVSSILDKENPEIVLKCIDSPYNIHLWIYEECRKKKIPFITGGILNGKGYIQSFLNYSKKNEHREQSIKKIFGTHPSHPYLIFKISMKMYEESVRLLENNEFIKYSELSEIKFEKYPDAEVYKKIINLMILIGSFILYLATNNILLSAIPTIGIIGQLKTKYKLIFLFSFCIGIVSIFRNFSVYSQIKYWEIPGAILFSITIPIILYIFINYAAEYMVYKYLLWKGYVNDTDS